MSKLSDHPTAPPAESVEDAKALCGLCGFPMPEGEEMFNYHGYSGKCPAEPLPNPDPEPLQQAKEFYKGCTGEYPTDLLAYAIAKFAEQYATKQIERFVEEVEKVLRYHNIAQGEEPDVSWAMQTVKARRSGGEGK